MADSAVLSSWSDGRARQSILDFVGEVTTVGGPDFVIEKTGLDLGKRASFYGGQRCGHAWPKSIL